MNKTRVSVKLEVWNTDSNTQRAGEGDDMFQCPGNITMHHNLMMNFGSHAPTTKITTSNLIEAHQEEPKGRHKWIELWIGLGLVRWMVWVWYTHYYHIRQSVQAKSDKESEKKTISENVVYRTLSRNTKKYRTWKQFSGLCLRDLWVALNPLVRVGRRDEGTPLG